jgi:hypothetical protein
MCTLPRSRVLAHAHLAFKRSNLATSRPKFKACTRREADKLHVLRKTRGARVPQLRVKSYIPIGVRDVRDDLRIVTEDRRN